MSSVAPIDIPLTTVFEPPASCTDVITRAGDIFWQGGRQQTGDPDCYPASFYSITGSYYSPGICPMGWTSAGAFFPPNSVTDAVCCPDGYTFTSNTSVTGSRGANFCASSMPATMTNVYSTTTIGMGPIPAHPTLSTVVASGLPTQFVWADLIQIEWAQTDTVVLSLMSSLATASLTSKVPSSTSATGTSSNTAANSTSPSSSGSGSHSNDAGAIAGGVVGGLVGAVILGALVFYLLRRRSGRTRAGAPLPGELDSKAPTYELHGSGQAAELSANPGQNHVHELAS